jgi:hypothetical protein
MDNGLNLSPETVSNLQNLSEKDKQELSQFVTQESRFTHVKGAGTLYH